MARGDRADRNASAVIVSGRGGRARGGTRRHWQLLDLPYRAWRRDVRRRTAHRDPFGAIHATNITPEPETGIGRWSEAAFRRAMREGVDRLGRHLYPAFPYDHFTIVTDEDIAAIYAFLMTRPPVVARAPANELAFPLQFRMLIAGWNFLFLDKRQFAPDPAQSAEWNRGRYLVEGLAHCGACHTPRLPLGAEDKQFAYSGAFIDGWYAYPINDVAPSPIRWTVASLADYLGNGWQVNHGVSLGPMALVTANLGLAADADVWAIATYVMSVMGPQREDFVAEAESLLRVVAEQGAGAFPGDPTMPGAPLYMQACAGCHDTGAPLPLGGVNLALSPTVRTEEPLNIANIILGGLPPAEGRADPLMPAFASVLTDEQIVALIEYIRRRFSKEDPWGNLAETVRAARQTTAQHSARAGADLMPRTGARAT